MANVFKSDYYDIFSLDVKTCLVLKAINHPNQNWITYHFLADTVKPNSATSVKTQSQYL